MIPGTVLLKRERGHEESSVFTPFEDKKKGRREKGREGRIPTTKRRERKGTLKPIKVPRKRMAQRVIPPF